MIDYIAIPTELSINGWEASRVDDADIGKTANRSETRRSPSPIPYHTYRIPFGSLNWDARHTLFNFFDARNGRVRGFLLWDRDYHYVANQIVGTGDNATTAFQLGVTRGDSLNSYYKPVWFPVPTGTAIPYELRGVVPGSTTTLFTVTVNGVAKTETTHYTVDPYTGRITFLSPPAAGQSIVVSFWYYTPVRFDGAELNMELDGIYGKVTTGMIELFNATSEGINHA